MIRTTGKVIKAKENEKYDYDPQRMKEMIDFYNNGADEEEKKEIMLFFINSLYGLMVEECNKFKNARYSFEELLSECQTEVIENIGGYEPIGPNGEFRKPSTYFGYIIRHAVQSMFNPESLTGHFAHIERQLKKAAAEYGIPYEKEYIRRLAKIADVSYQSALSAFVRSNTTHEEFNAETSAEKSEDYGQPEEIMADREKKEKIRELIDRLPVREKYVVMQIYFNDISIDELVIEMSKVTGESLSKKDVVRIQRSAFNKLEPMLRKQGYGGRRGYFHPVFVRSDEELDEEMMDIASAFDDDAGSTILIKLNLK